MYCPNQLIHIIRKGDNLYQLSRRYKTSVTQILSRNPNIDPYNLQTGTKITICPGPNFKGSARPPSHKSTEKRCHLIKDMRLRWSQHVYWSRMLLISIAEGLKDQDAVTARITQIPAYTASVFGNYYPSETVKTIARLLTEHFETAAELIAALRDGRTAEADALNRRWYKNADDLAGAFSGVNPYYDREAIRNMLHNHLELTGQEIAMRLEGNYPADINAFDAVEHEALLMSDMLSVGIIRQFPQMFV